MFSLFVQSMSARQLFHLGLKSFAAFSSFGVSQRKFASVSAVYLGIRAMASKRLLSDSSEPASAAMQTKVAKKPKGLALEVSNSSKGLIQESNAADSDTIQGIMNDPTRIDVMTIQELRATLRLIGIPAKGCKSDLVSSLKGYMDEKTNGTQLLSGNKAMEQVSSVCVVSSITEKSKDIVYDNCVETVNSVSKVSGVKRSKKRGKQSEDNIIESDAVTFEQMQSVKADQSTGKVSHYKRKVSTKVCTEVQALGDVDRSIMQPEPWTILAHTKPQKHWVPYNPRIMRPPPLPVDTKSVKLMSWNVNGLRALLKMEGFSALELARREDFDVLCLQETKLQEKDVEAIRHSLIDGYENSFWTCSVAKLGYSGTAIVSRVKPLSVTYGLGISDHDSEGRLVTVEFEKFYLLCGYVPNSGDGLKRLPYRITQWDPSLGSYMKELEKVKPVILTGDLNCAHQEIDIYNPAGNKRSAGFTVEERQSFEDNFLSKGFVDTFRRQHPDTVGYTYWGYRHGARKTNKGWRLDYFLVSESIADNVHDSFMLPDVTGSDHCPLGLILKL